MEDTQDLSARMTKLQENVLRWEHLFQSEAAGQANYVPGLFVPQWSRPVSQAVVWL